MSREVSRRRSSQVPRNDFSAQEGPTGLYYYRNRYYHAELGRFVSRDPIAYGGGWNLHGYVGSWPTGATDPLGLKCHVCGSRVLSGGDSLAQLDGEVDGNPYTDLMRFMVNIADTRYTATSPLYKFFKTASGGAFAFQEFDQTGVKATLSPAVQTDKLNSPNSQ